MGFYINPSSCSKEEWLKENAKQISEDDARTFAYSANMPNILVCLVDNLDLGFSAAGVMFSSREREAFMQSCDTRPKIFWSVTWASLEEVIDKKAVDLMRQHAQQ